MDIDNPGCPSKNGSALDRKPLAWLDRLNRLRGSWARRATLESLAMGFFGQLTIMLSGIIAARILGVDGRGHLALLVLFPTVIVQFGGLGLPNALTFYLARHRGSARVMWKRVSRLAAAQAFGLVAVHGFVLLIYLEGMPETIKTAAIWALVATPALVAQRYGLSVLQGLGRYRAFNTFGLLPALVYTGTAAGLLVAGDGGLEQLVMFWTIAYVLTGLITLSSSLRLPEMTVTSGVGAASLPSLRAMLAFGLRGLVGSASPLQVFRLDQLAAGLFLSPAALGLYVVGQAFANLPLLVAQSVGYIVYPEIARQTQHESAWRVVWRSFWGVSLLNLIILVPLLLFLPTLVPLLFGSDFSGAIPLAQILLAGAFFDASRRILVEALRGMGRPQVSTYSELLMYPWFLIAGGILLISGSGVLGLAMTVTVGHGVVLLGVLIMIRRYRGEQRIVIPAGSTVASSTDR